MYRSTTLFAVRENVINVLYSIFEIMSSILASKHIAFYFGTLFKSSIDQLFETNEGGGGLNVYGNIIWWHLILISINKSTMVLYSDSYLFLMIALIY